MGTKAATQPELTKLQRIALDQQGLLRAQSFGRGKSGTAKTIEHLGYVQIDTISVVSRAHHHVLRTRVPNYQPRFLDALISERCVFEYWYHAAAYLPMQDYRFALPRMRSFRDGSTPYIRSSDRKLMKQVLARVRTEGPLMARDFEMPKGTGTQGWWDWKPAKRALEQLFMQGDLMLTTRQGFQKVYDLTERVLPSRVNTRFPTIRQMAEHLLDNALRSHGFVTPQTVTHLRRGKPLRDALSKILSERLAGHHLIPFKLGKQTGYVPPKLLESRLRPRQPKVRILSPFDNSIIHRDRASNVYGFDYQIECYVPEAKRRYGYYCLPLLYGDRFVGRMDCKAHRNQKHFEVKHLFVEQPVDDGFVPAFASAAREYAQFNGCTTCTLTKCTPTRWKKSINATLSL